MKKVLGIMLLFILFAALSGCDLTTAATTSGAPLEAITVEVYDGGTIPVLRAEVAGFAATDTVLDVLMDRFKVWCADAEGEPDDTCKYEGAYGVYLVGIAGVMADGANEYIAFYVDGEYALAGVGTTTVVAGSVYAFRLETF